MSRSLVLVLVLAASLLAACGSSDSGGSSTETKAPAPAATSAAAAAAPSGDKVIALCHTAFDPLVNKLRDLQGDVSVGSGYTAYSAAVEELRLAYRGIDLKAIPSHTCLYNVGAPAEKAFNEYVAARNIWSECGKGASCDKSTIEARLQKGWSTAGKFTGDASKAFATVTPA